MSAKRLVTVYIPTRNRLNLLQRALRSVASQTYSNIEIIVADDGSTDGTQDFLRELQKGQAEDARLSALGKDNRIQVILSGESKGACHARNQAIAIASGSYITGLDDDDEFMPQHVEILLAAYEERDVSFVACSHIMRYGNEDRQTHFGIGECSLEQILHSNVVGNQVLTKTKYLQAIGGFDEDMVALQDYETWIRLIKDYGPGYKIRQATYVLYTEHTERISAKIDRKQAGWQRLQQKHGHLMSTRQIKSQQMVRLWMGDSKPGLLETLRYVHTDNWKTALNIYLRRLPKPLNRIAARILGSRFARYKAAAK